MGTERSDRLALSGMDRKGKGAKGGEQHGTCQLGMDTRQEAWVRKEGRVTRCILCLLGKVTEPWVQKSRIRCCVIVLEFWDTQLGLNVAISCLR